MKDMSAKDIMSSPAITVESSTSLSEVVKILQRHSISGLPVVDKDKKAIGIISEKDLLKYTHFVVGQPLRDICQLLEEKDEVTHISSDRGVNMVEAVASATAGVAMTDKIITVKENTPAMEIVRLMNKHNINRLPVVNEEDKVIGMVTRANILQMLEQWSDNN